MFWRATLWRTASGGRIGRVALACVDHLPLLVLIGTRLRMFATPFPDGAGGAGADRWHLSCPVVRLPHNEATVSSVEATLISFSTWDTPGAAHAAHSACSRSFQLSTAPRRMTFPSLVSTEIVWASRSAARSKARSIRCLMSFGAVCGGFTEIRLVTPLTPLMPRTAYSAATLS